MNDNDMRRVPPYNADAERSVIGSILMDNKTIELIDILTADDFYLEAHKKTFQVIIKNYKTTAIDIVTIGALFGDELNKVGGITFIAALVDDIPSAANIVYYAKIVKENSIRRRLLDTAYQITELAYGPDDLKEVIEKSQKSVMAINPLSQCNTIKSAKDVVKSTFEQIETRNKKGGLVGLSTGIADLDDATGGLHPGDLTIIAGRPGMGKTVMADNIAHYCGMRGDASLIFSIEMPNEALMIRMLSSMTKIENRNLRKGYVQSVDWPKLVDASSRIGGSQIYFDDSPMITPQELRIRARKAKADYDIKLLVLDYIQLMQPSSRGRSREQEVSEISSTLKGIARELSIAVIGVSQLNRELEKRPDKRPTMADLRESGAIEQDADTILFIYRDEIYHKAEDNPEKGIAEIGIGKNRNGQITTIKCVFSDKYQKFSDMAHQCRPIHYGDSNE
jgi:replicative DNA helicase